MREESHFYHQNPNQEKQSNNHLGNTHMHAAIPEEKRPGKNPENTMFEWGDPYPPQFWLS